MGSVKDLKIIKPATKTELGEGRFIYSDRFSVFDWGEMPDTIPQKGAAISILAAYFFEELEKNGKKTHYKGLVEGGNVKKLSELKELSSEMAISLLNVVKPILNGDEYDYSPLKDVKSGFLIPLEVIYRNTLPEGSSVFRRLKKGSLKFEDMGLKEEPKPGQKLDPPFVDVSTKLEITDRYISWKEAQEISFFSDEEIKTIKETIVETNDFITKEFEKIGLKNEDGKFEFGFNEKRELIFVDVLGTLDECRFTYEGKSVSKEIARKYYRKTKWYEDVLEAKEKDRQNWKKICKSQPEPLPEELKTAISNVYKSVTNSITKKKWFKNTPSIEEIMKVVDKYI